MSEEKIWALIASCDSDNVVMGFELLEALSLPLDEFYVHLKIPTEIDTPFKLYNWAASYFPLSHYAYLWTLGYLALQKVPWVCELGSLRISTQQMRATYLPSISGSLFEKAEPEAVFFPDMFSNLELDALDLSGNYLSQIPSCILRMPLKKLSLSNNLFRVLQFSEGDFPDLVQLELSHCPRLLTLSFSSGACASLKQLFMHVVHLG